MAILSSDGKYVTVEKGDNLWNISKVHFNGGANYKQLAAINNIPNPNLIYPGQKIYLSKDGSGGGSSSTKTSSTSNACDIIQFGEISNEENQLFATWSWGKESQTESYKVLWSYDTGDGVWFSNGIQEIKVDDDARSMARQSTFSIPANARRVKFKVKPISKTYEVTITKNAPNTNNSSSGGGGGIVDKVAGVITNATNSVSTVTSTTTEKVTKTYWTIGWSAEEEWRNQTPIEAPPAPTVTIEKYRLKAELNAYKGVGTHVVFRVVKNNSGGPFSESSKIKIVSEHAAYECNVDAGGQYKAYCMVYKDSDISDWGDFSENVQTIPQAPTGITTCRASSKTSAYLEWNAINNVKSYDIEYATKKEYFDFTSQTTVQNGIETTKFEFIGLETGAEYFFRLRAVNDAGESAWSEIVSTILGTTPSAPTTWSSTTTAITGEPLTLYWVHNSKDGSSQTTADLEIYVNGVKESHQIENTTDEETKDKTSSYVFNTKPYNEGTTVEWRVRTAGITNSYGDWSVLRTVNIYAPPTLEIKMTNSSGEIISTVETFPIYVSALAGPNTQIPTGYHVSITANETYEAVDTMGNPMNVNAGDEVYSKYYDIMDSLLLELSAGSIDLENNIEYTLSVTVSMNSGLTHETSQTFRVAWTDMFYEPNAEITINTKTYTAYIKPYCEIGELTNFEVAKSGDIYTLTNTDVGRVFDNGAIGAKTQTGEVVYSGVSEDGEEIYYTIVDDKKLVDNILLSVYRREFDGSFVEIATEIDNAKQTTITDPHPSLDFARYRIVAISKDTGAVSYNDLPGVHMGGPSIIIQWNEAWSNFEITEDADLVHPPWFGSLLELPYNIDVSDNNKVDVSMVNYIGRKHPVSYYGTQVGETSTWNTEIPADDKETIYALRRLAKWMEDVYVREPSGLGYWASISVSFNQTHCELTIPVTLNITRVEGGV